MNSRHLAPVIGHAAGQIGADGFHESANVICLIVAGPANYFETPKNKIECNQKFMICQTLVLTFVGTGTGSTLVLFVSAYILIKKWRD